LTSSTLLTEPQQIPLPLDLSVQLPDVFARVFRRMAIKHPAPDFQVEYRPFAGLRSTIQLRGERATVRVSDVLAGAPLLVLEALAEILLAHAFRRRPSREARECYLAYVFRPAVRRRIDDARRRRGPRHLRPARGRWYDLDEMFQRVNRRFFGGELPAPCLGWSLKRSRTLLGHYDSAHATITLSRVLDSPSVPRYVVEYLVYHEMLHMKFPVERRGHCRVVHSREFRKAEKKFPRYDQIRRRLRRFCA
jgi:hypothetical protein